MFCLLVLALVPPETLDMEDKSEANTAVTIGSEDFATVYRSCFSDNMNNNVSVATVNVGDKVLMITGDTMDLVMEAGDVLKKYFNVEPEESKIEEAEAVEADAVEAALPGPLPEDVVSGEDTVAGEMETDSGQVTEMPALDCAVGGGGEDTGAELLETEAQDLPGPALATGADTGAEETESIVQEPSSSTGGQSVSSDSGATRHKFT